MPVFWFMDPSIIGEHFRHNADFAQLLEGIAYMAVFNRPGVTGAVL